MDRKRVCKSGWHTVDERIGLIAAYRQSGLSQKGWCEEQGIALSTLGNWLKKYKSLTVQQNPQDGMKFFTTPPVQQEPQNWANVPTMPPVRQEPQIRKRTSETPLAQQEPQGWTKVSVSQPVREQIIMLRAGKFSIEVNQNTDMQLLSKLLTMLAQLC